jgi:hypothetical protein
MDPQIPTTNTLTDYGFEGLSRAERGGKTLWEPSRNFVLYIDGETGNCRIPDTENNRKRLERLSKGGKETVKRIVLDDNGQTQTKTEEIETPPTYKMMEQNLATSTLVNTVAMQVMALMRNGIQSESDAPIPDNVNRPAMVKKTGKTNPLVEPTPSILDPIK